MGGARLNGESVLRIGTTRAARRPRVLGQRLHQREHPLKVLWAVPKRVERGLHYVARAAMKRGHSGLRPVRGGLGPELVAEEGEVGPGGVVIRPRVRPTGEPCVTLPGEVTASTSRGPEAVEA
jgi:hypothetical protein